MFKISVPLMRYAEFHEENLNMLRRFGASRVFLCLPRGLGGYAEREAICASLKKNVRFYSEAGYEVGVWISTIGHGGALEGVEADGVASDFTRLLGLKGGSSDDSFCPLDPAFSSTVCNYIADIAKCGPSMIMIDDDYRLASRNDCGCTCKRHIEEYEKRLGESIDRADVLHLAFSGGKNRYRDAWLDMMGDTLRNFARDMRAAVDSVDPSIRLGACSCMSVWDQDGVDSIEIARILAGGTRPFIRLIGAAYWPMTWDPPCDRLAYVAELERMQAYWCKNEDIEIFGEGDVYPRPRYAVPAAYLECFETILRADGGLWGCHKYGVDYFSSPNYETGYAIRAERNRELAEAFSRAFDGKRAVGVGVACEMKKIQDKVFHDAEGEIGASYDGGFFQTEQQLLTNCSFPITYENAPVTAIFGENARSCDLSALRSGILIDAAAAKLLTERGLDVGFVDAKPLAKVGSIIFPTLNDRTFARSSDGAVELVVSKDAEVLATYDGAPEKPFAVKYENADGLRVITLGFIGDLAKNNATVSRNYCLPRLLSTLLEWAGREPLAALCTGHPDLYLLAKSDGEAMSVGLWNLFADAVFTPTVTLGDAYSSLTTIGCEAVLKGNKVRLTTDIQPFGFAAFTVSKA